MTRATSHRARLVVCAALLCLGCVSAAWAVDPGIGVGKPGVGVTPGPGVGAPGPGVRDPGINQPGAAGNVGAPGLNVVDPGLNQPGVIGNVGGVARRSVRR